MTTIAELGVVTTKFPARRDSAPGDLHDQRVTGAEGRQL